MRILPPGTAANSSISINGRSYSATPGIILDVPDFDAHVLEANGWMSTILFGAVGQTSARPAKPKKWERFLDTTIADMVIWDGVTWRHHVTGASS